VIAAAGDAAVVCLTGSDDARRGAAAVAAGAQDYLVKGTVDGELLHRAIRYAVERRRADEQSRQLMATRVRTQENARLERGLLPLPVVEDPRVSVTARYRPGRDALLGGDFYDVVEVADGTLLVLVGDVAGHGPDEAALGVCLRIAWRTLVLAGTPVERLLPVVEDVLVHERRSDEVFTTACMVAVAPDRRSAQLWSGGHPAPFLLGPRPLHLLPDEQGPALGLLPGGSWEPTHVDLPPAWRLLLFTDGLVEGHTGEGAERLGTEGLTPLLADTWGVPTGDVAAPATDAERLDLLLAEVTGLNRGPLSDDVAVLVVGASEGERL
jgi:serine phosphatase RsbU (regulator of sigma subunit)